MPLVFDPGEAFLFDWSHELVLLAGMPVTVKVARMPFVRCYPRETQEMVFDVHDRTFATFGGHCGRRMHDNMSTAVTRVLLGRNREINRRFLQTRAHYVITPEFCTLRTVLFKPRPAVETLDCLNPSLTFSSSRSDHSTAFRAGFAPKHPGNAVNRDKICRYG